MVSNMNVAETRDLLLKRIETLPDKKQILRAPELRELYSQIKDLHEDQRASFGQSINDLKKELEALAFTNIKSSTSNLAPIDVTAPMDVNSSLPELLSTENGTVHPLMKELSIVIDIFSRMGLNVAEAPQLDNDYHMFTSLNFPEEHPARDDYDTFITEEGFVAPAHVSTMQNRLLKKYKSNLDEGQSIGAMYLGRTFRNEDVDARHEHTFNQVEFLYVDKGINVGNLIATLKTFLEEYYGKEINIRTTPFYFPFTEPSFELALSCPFCDGRGCHICGKEGWIELLGCGLMNPKVLEMGGIDPNVYTGFAAGLGFDRLVMMKHDIEDVRHFNSGKLAFLRQFK